MKPLTYKDIEANIETSDLKRGKEYFLNGHVKSLSWNEDAKHLDATVKGRHSYTQEIHLNQRGASIDIDGYCSCPMDYNCKHVAAVLLEYIGQYKSITGKKQLSHDSPFQNWQKRFQVVLAEDEPAKSKTYFKPSPGVEFVVYILKYINNKDFSIHRYYTKKYKKGGFAPLKSYTNNYWYYSRQIESDIDNEINSSLGHAEELSSARNPYLALKQLANCGRAYLGAFEPSSLLKEGIPLDLTFVWEEQNGFKQLKINLGNIKADDWSVVATDPTCYFNRTTKKVGKINSQLSSELLDMLRAMPALDSSQQLEVAGLLRTQLSDQSIPLPIEWQVVEIDEEPIPKLLISKNNRNQQYIGELIFEYNGHDLPYTVSGQSVQQMTMKDNIEYKIITKPNSEQQAITQLAVYNYTPVDFNVDGFIDNNVKTVVIVANEPTEYYRFISEIAPNFREQGWVIDETEVSEQFNTIDTWDLVTNEEGVGWFSLALDIEINGVKVAVLPLIVQWLEQLSPGYTIQHAEKPVCLAHPDFGWIVVPAETINSIVDILVELYDRPTLTDEGKLKIASAHVMRIQALAEALQKVRWLGDKSIKQLSQKLANFQGIKKLKPPRGLKATLRDYQQEGVEWLQFLRNYKFGGILADDMGLGKTIQVLSHIQLEKERGRLKQPVMVVVPTSVIGNWQKEAAKFTPSLKTLIWYGIDRSEHYEFLPEYQLIITSYGTFQRDAEELAEYEFHMFILDEAQYIKNSKSKIAAAVRTIKANHYLCMTGTPLENHLGEFWALYDFIMPGFLGSEHSFYRLFRRPIEIEGSQQRHHELSQRVAPFLLRRTKEAVAEELPEKTEMIRSVEFGSTQQKLYESIRLSMEKKVRNLLKTKGLNRSRIEILDALMKLRQVCCDPSLVKLDKAKKVKQSAKLDLLKELLVELLDENRKVLLFSQFTSMLSIIEKELTKLKIPYVKLTGQTRKREEVITAFQNGEVPLFLISLKAGGVGLNLTQADTVIHYDPWWNPAVEQQATDRAYRIGQDKPVFVYRLICSNTVEEKILTMQEKKQQLADGIYNNKAGDQLGLTKDDILDLFKPAS